MTLHAINGGRARGNNANGQQVPHNTDAEEALLGAMLYTTKAVAAAGHLGAVDFYDPGHGHIYEAITSLVADDQPADPVTVAEHLRLAGLLEVVGGPATLINLQSAVPATGNAGHYAAIVARHALARRILELAGELAESARDLIDPAVIVTKLKDDVDALVGATNRRQRLFNAADLIVGHLDVIADRGDNPQDESLGIRTGWREIDQLLGGFRPGQLIVIAGRPGMGKSAMAAGIALRTAIGLDRRVLTVSIEMSKEELLDRYVAAMAGVDLTRVRSGQLDADEWCRCNKAADKFDGKNIWVLDDPTATLPSINAAAQRMEADLIVVDYLQIVESLNPPGSKSRTREREVAELSGGLKRMARDLGVPMLALSQFNRELESRQSDKRPQLTDLRESGAIENDADAVVGLYRDDYYNPNLPDGAPTKGVLEMIVLKQRNGPTGTARLKFDAHTGHIGNLPSTGRF